MKKLSTLQLHISSLLLTVALLLGCVSQKTISANGLGSDGVERQPPVIDDGLPQHELRHQLDFDDTVAKLRRKNKNKEAELIETSYRRADELWSYCMVPLVDDAYVTPQKGIVLIRRNKLVLDIVLVAPKPSIDWQDCSQGSDGDD